ncbi:uncharacterized protein LOC109722597 [Ananas comosus]|uniref:Uncharacterized protein LOC109722597 n=1 Tax=Ananas comosus TaxID=4615 RepID=A0A6P5GEI2_ANACO|nr:uncharacterized protein LOC109722597 [Ananas comosus]
MLTRASARTHARPPAPAPLPARVDSPACATRARARALAPARPRSRKTRRLLPYLLRIPKPRSKAPSSIYHRQSRKEGERRKAEKRARESRRPPRLTRGRSHAGPYSRERAVEEKSRPTRPTAQRHLPDGTADGTGNRAREGGEYGRRQTGRRTGQATGREKTETYRTGQATGRLKAERHRHEGGEQRRIVRGDATVFPREDSAGVAATK